MPDAWADLRLSRRGVVGRGDQRNWSAGSVGAGWVIVTAMANRHFGKVADVWKHLLLVEILAVDQPANYGETHVGSAGYQLVDDDERRFGVVRFLEVAAISPLLAKSSYRAHLEELVSGEDAICPGSPLLAMRQLGGSARYVCCDLDADSVADITRWAGRQGLGDRVEAIEVADGMATVTARFLGGDATTDALVHIDPYDPHARQPGGPPALDVAPQLADGGVAVVYWYGYDVPTDRAWPVEWLRRAAPGVSWWCSDMLVATADGTTRDGGQLGLATTPGTGFGIVAAHISDAARGRCERLARALADAYADTPLPDGTRGRLDHRIVS